MPIKRRVDKSRTLDRSKIREMHHGPGTCLLAGCGYWEGDFWHRLGDGLRERIVRRMRDDWERHSATVLQAWEDRDEHDRWIDAEHYDDLQEPWALTEFGPIEEN